MGEAFTHTHRCGKHLRLLLIILLSCVCGLMCVCMLLLMLTGVKAVDLTTCEGDTAQLSCDLTSHVTACESDTAHLYCDQGRIQVLSANYGRTNSATCSNGKPANQVSNVQCTQDSSLSVLTNRCDGQKYCSISASNIIFGDPCVGTYKYLDVSYICIPSGAVLYKRTSCEGGTFRINCYNRIIKVVSANYGRTNRVTCSTGKPADQISNVQCTQSSSLSVLAAQCDGKQACSVSTSNTVFGDPCVGTYKYLNAFYICHPNHFIKVSAANYGRTNRVTCSTGKPADQISNVQCFQSSSLSVLAAQCDGKQVCSIPATNTVFGDPCVGTYKYLDVSYTCGPSKLIPVT
ncbi:L-rhamnose-binding lectin CSL3-like [Paramisgurnus dabryanus]|uniref:L-rhamnose-binding lectin CSL3-like n=1 Tax=Paramisgurnus dabryanus TaxID=90735 RepID=UPI003CCF0A0B